jgi:3-deoxy-D-arabino-heptulosonate 7-phosphate (DAHP) synthase class II
MARMQAYLELAKNVDQAVQFMNAAGLQSSSPIMAETEFYVSHEALLLDYEQALTRLDSTTGRWCVQWQLDRRQSHDEPLSEEPSSAVAWSFHKLV